MAISVVGTAQTIDSSTIALPSGIAAHDTIIVAYGLGSGSRTATGFTAIGENLNPRILYKMDADGTEGTSLAVSGGSVRAANVIVLRGVDTSTPVEYVNRTSDLNPPSITPSWGSGAASGFIAIGYSANQTVGIAVTGYPTNYTDSQSAATGDRGGGYAFMAIGLRLATLASDDPSNFTINQTPDTTNARTIAVKEAAAASASSGNFFMMFR